MRVSGVSEKGADLSVSGQLIDGAYAGPEAVIICGQDSQWVVSMITQHAIKFPKGWPVVPDDGSTLILSIAKPHDGFNLDRAQLIVGHGVITRNPDRVDISTSLNDPAFWATWIPLHIESEKLPEPVSAWGLTGEEANKEYADRFESHWNDGIWPYVQFALPERRYVEIEFASGIEHQNRVWIGVREGPRVLLGYDSGHFSFPTMRMPELLDLARRMDGHTSAPLLLLAGAYLVEGEPFPSDAARRWLGESPGFRKDYMDAVLSELANNVVPKLVWELEDERGWTNNWQYSQRNPASRMSILGAEDFRFIREFFTF